MRTLKDCALGGNDFEKMKCRKKKCLRYCASTLGDMHHHENDGGGYKDVSFQTRANTHTNIIA